MKFRFVAQPPRYEKLTHFQKDEINKPKKSEVLPLDYIVRVQGQRSGRVPDILRSFLRKKP